MVEHTVTLYRLIGPTELKLLEQSSYKRWPARLPEQPIFYAVTNEAYAEQITSRWNVKDRGVGNVTRFEVKRDFIEKYLIQKVGAAIHTEWWIQAEDLEKLNDNIIGTIDVISKFANL